MKNNLYSPLIPVAFNLEQRIINLLMFRANFLKDTGLLSGKMGIVLFFASYHRLCLESIYETIADELMEQVIEAVHKELPIGLGSGLSGIGWGIEFLIQNGLLEGDSVEICEEIDRKIMERDPRRITDFSLETGLEGILHYVLAHINGTIKGHLAMPFDKTYLFDLYSTLDSLSGKEGMNEDLVHLIDEYVQFYEGRKSISYKPAITSFIGLSDVDENKITTYPIGIKDGLTGFLFKSFIERMDMNILTDRGVVQRIAQNKLVI